MDRLKQALAWVVFSFVLFACVYLSRVFLAGRIVAFVVTEANLAAIALVATVAALLPGLPLGFAYGLIHARPVVSTALAVAAGASAIELALATYSVNWWEFVSWWVLPLECAILVVCFPAVAVAGAALGSRIRPAVRVSVGIALFALAAVGIAAWPWL